jgi:hypothetical protein
MYAVYNWIHNEAHAGFIILVSWPAIVVYEQRLVFVDHIQSVPVHYETPSYFYRVTEQQWLTGRVQLIALPNDVSLKGVIDVSNVLFSDGPELVLMKTPLTDQYIRGQLASLDSA